MQSRDYKREWNRKWRANPENRAKEIARQRILNKLNPRRKVYVSKNVARWREKYPERAQCHRAVFVALRNGTLFKLPCEHCLEVNEKVQAHHPDYSKPLEVIWLCKVHHILADKKRKL